MDIVLVDNIVEAGKADNTSDRSGRVEDTVEHRQGTVDMLCSIDKVWSTRESSVLWTMLTVLSSLCLISLLCL